MKTSFFIPNFIKVWTKKQENLNKNMILSNSLLKTIKQGSQNVYSNSSVNSNNYSFGILFFWWGGAGEEVLKIAFEDLF